MLRNALETKKAEFERAMDEISTLRASEAEVSADFKAKTMELQEALDNKATKTEALQSELAALHATRETSTAVSTTLKAKYEEAKRQISALQAAETRIRVDLEAKITELIDAADTSAKTEALQSELVDVRKARDTAGIATATLEIKYEESLKQISSLHAQLDKATSSHSAEFQRRTDAPRRARRSIRRVRATSRGDESASHRARTRRGGDGDASIEIRRDIRQIGGRQGAARHRASRFASEREELERALVEAKETSAAALSAVQTERESMRDAKKNRPSPSSR